MLESDIARRQVREFWETILIMVRDGESQMPVTASLLTAMATSFSFGLDEKCTPAEDGQLMSRFAAYLRIVLEERFTEHIPQDIAQSSRHTDGYLFGKPVWDFEYPQSCFFVTEDGVIEDAVCLQYGLEISPAFPSVVRIRLSYGLVATIFLLWATVTFMG